MVCSIWLRKFYLPVSAKRFQTASVKLGAAMQILARRRVVHRLCLITSITLAIACVGVFVFYYLKYARIVDDKLRSGVSESASTIFSAPRTVVVGGEGKIEEIASYLRRCGYAESESN
jgi:hypothetical protein